MLSDKRSVRDLVELCYQKGIRQVVISPGSRNAPLTISFNEHGSFECFSIIDERSAAFFALGLSQSSKNSTILVCTSGSAMLNYAPAIVEAFYQHIPLLIVTADRPVRWIDQGEGQSMQQFNAYKNFIRKSINLLEPNKENFIRKNIDQINAALIHMNHPSPGPVHINIPLDEPLYDTREYNIPLPKLSPIKKDLVHISNEKQIILNEKWKQSEKIMILTGLLEPNEEINDILEKIDIKYSNVIVLTETTSNLTSNHFIHNIDRNLSTIPAEDIDDFAPHLLITLGHNLISKKIKYWLREILLEEHWHIDQWGDFQDTFAQLSNKIQAFPYDILNNLSKIETLSSSDYQNKWKNIATKSHKLHHTFISKCVWSDLKVFSHIIHELPKNISLQIANSTVIRYLQLFDTPKSWIHHSNRGVSGIDGCTSTALGASNNTDKLTVFITGDISFGYDSNAFWHNQLNGRLRIIVIANGGGGIFRFIEGPNTTNQLEKYFETPRQGDAKAISNRYDLPYFYADDEKSLIDILPLFLGNNKSDKPMILEISTPRKVNDKVLKSYFKYHSSK